jgi:hypothetical protein
MTELKDVAKGCADAFMAAEIALIGRQTADDVMEAAVSGEKLEFDSSTSRDRQNDIIDAIKLLFEFAAFVKTLVDLYELFKSREGRRPSPEELLAEARVKSNEGEPKQAAQVAQAVVDQLEKAP